MFFQFVSDWSFDVSADRVWDVLCRYEAAPEWWPSVPRVEVVDRDTVRWWLRTPYGVTLAFTQHTLAAERARHLLFRATGDLVGTGAFTLVPIAPGCRVLFSWDVDLTRPLLRTVSRLPIAQGILRRAHATVMREAYEGLTRRLAQTAP